MANFTKLYAVLKKPSRLTALSIAFLLLFASATFAPMQSFGQSASVATEVGEDAPTIVVLGDSLVAGYQLPQGDGFPDKLQSALTAKGIMAKIVGAGVSGDTTSGGLARLDWSVAEGTDAVILELGANDALRGLPPETSRTNLETILQRLKERDIKVLLVGMLAPPNMGEDYADQFNQIYPDLAEKYELPFYPFFLEGVLTKPENLLEDGIHPNSRGVEIMVGNVLPIVEGLIEELRPIP